MKKQFLAMLATAGLAVAALPGCTQMPTEKQGISDLRPQLSFKLADESLRSARVLVDNLDMGTVGDYLDGSASLRIVPGTHAIRVELGGRSLVDERIYAGDGVNRSILVK